MGARGCRCCRILSILLLLLLPLLLDAEAVGRVLADDTFVGTNDHPSTTARSFMKHKSTPIIIITMECIVISITTNVTVKMEQVDGMNEAVVDSIHLFLVDIVGVGGVVVVDDDEE